MKEHKKHKNTKNIMTFHFNEEEKIMKKTCKILTEKEYEYIKNCIQNIAVNVKEYGFILSEQM